MADEVRKGDRFKARNYRPRKGPLHMIVVVLGIETWKDGTRYAWVKRNTSRRQQSIREDRLLSSAYERLPRV